MAKKPLQRPRKNFAGTDTLGVPGRRKVVPFPISARFRGDRPCDFGPALRMRRPSLPHPAKDIINCQLPLFSDLTLC
jgi:hypothetical protein